MDRMTLRSPCRRAFTLLEVGFTFSLMATLGLAMISLFQGGSRQSARAGEAQLASVIGRRTMDRLVAIPFAELERFAGQEEDLDLAHFLEGVESADPAGVLEVDRLSFDGTVRVEAVEQGLIRVIFVLSWNRPGAKESASTGTLVLRRFLADAGRGTR